MQLTKLQFEMKHSDEKKWMSVSEKSVLKSLFDNFESLSLILDKLFQGEEILFRDLAFRIRKP